MLLLLLLLLPILWKSTYAKERCSDAPEEGIRIICQQIEQWDKNARTVPPIMKPLHSVHAASKITNRVANSFYDCMDIPCLCGFFKGHMSNDWCRLPNGQFLGKALRKEYRQMTDQERSSYHAATWKMRQDGTYSELSRIHSNFTIAAGAHSGPAFLPWHREYIKRMEFALRKIDPTISLPYWDSTLDNNIPNPLDSVLWGEELMGYPSMQNTLLSGSFSHWRTDDNTRYVRRCLGEQAALMNEEHIKSFMAFTSIDDVLASTASRTGCSRTASWSSLEFTHGNPHVYVGGDMLVTTNSTNDPLFFLHHSFIDLLWESWRQSKQSAMERESQYPDDDAACNSMSHFSNAIMQPFAPMTNMDGLSNIYEALNSYLERPSCNAITRDCKSRFLFCDLSHGRPRCAARIRRGGNCTGFTNDELPCYEGQCIENICIDRDIQTSSSTLTTSIPILSTTMRISTTLSSTVSMSSSASPFPISTTSRTISTTRPIVTTLSTSTPFLTTTRPFTLTTLKSTTAAPSLCLNDNHCCQGWADYGECRNNPGYMNKHCMASCNVCTPSFNLTIECDNRAKDCEAKVSENGCNTPWMFENCREKCKLCDQSRKWQCTLMGTSRTPSSSPPPTSSQTTAITTPTSASTITKIIKTIKASTTTKQTVTASLTTSPFVNSTQLPLITQSATTPSQISKPTCWNYHYCCKAWAFKDFCSSKNNSVYMNHYCAPSCNTCRIGSKPTFDSKECRDNHPSCKYWAGKNECELSSEFMYENCMQSCGKCELLNMSTRLDICGYQKQQRLSQDFVSNNSFDINPWEMVNMKLMRKLHKSKTEFTSV